MDIPIEQKQGFRWKKHGPFVAAGAFLLLIGAWILFGNHAATLRVSANELTISDVRRAHFKDYIRMSGQVLPIEVVQISPEEGGIVLQRVAEEGQMVHKGDVIIRMANSNLDLQILNAEAELAEKQNLLRNTQIAMQQDRLNNQTEMVQLDIDTRRKQRSFEQNKRLYNEHLIKREDYLQAQEDFQLSQKKRQLVAKRLRQDSLSRSTQMNQMEDNLQAMQRNLALVRQRKQKLEVRSTITGELGLLDVELGQSVTAGQKIGQINDLSDYKIQAQIDEAYIDRVRTGLKATVERGGKKYELIVRKIYPEVRQGKFRADFVFHGPRPEQLRSGQTYYLELELGQSETAILIPRGTFFQTTGGQWIFVLNKNATQAYRRNIRIGRQNPQYYEVMEGLEPGERVITSGYEAYKNVEQLTITR